MQSQTQRVGCPHRVLSKALVCHITCPAGKTLATAVRGVDRASCRTGEVSQNSFGQSLLKIAWCKCPWLLLLFIGWIQDRCSTAWTTLSNAAGSYAYAVSHILTQTPNKHMQSWTQHLGCLQKLMCRAGVCPITCAARDIVNSSTRCC